jgi:hypothetical protein
MRLERGPTLLAFLGVSAEPPVEHRLVVVMQECRVDRTRRWRAEHPE